MVAIATALVRPPGPRLAEGIATHSDRQPVDVTLALRQWDRYVEALAASGWEIVEVPQADDCPDAVFVEDALVVHHDLVVIARPGAASRRLEVAGAEETVESLGYRIARITAPGRLDGGDVLKVGDTVYVGIGRRTNAEGVRLLRALLEPRGATVVAVPVHDNALHLRSALTSLPDGSIIGYPALIDTPERWERFVEVPEPSGANVVVLGGGRVLMADDCPGSADVVARLGYEPVTVDIGEFQKLDGGVTCLSVRLRAKPA